MWAKFAKSFSRGHSGKRLRPACNSPGRRKHRNQATDSSTARDNPLSTAPPLSSSQDFFRNLVAIILINHCTEYATLNIYFLDCLLLILCFCDSFWELKSFLGTVEILNSFERKWALIPVFIGFENSYKRCLKVCTDILLVRNPKVIFRSILLGACLSYLCIYFVTAPQSWRVSFVLYKY